MEKFLVGGAVRDELLGVKSKDLDYTVVLSGNEAGWRVTTDPFKVMVKELELSRYKIFLETPEYFTVRAQTPDRRETADFVLARKESDYTDGRRPDRIEMGTLFDDLSRRDFTFNAIAKDADGSFIDPFNGRVDIEAGIIRAVGDPLERLTEDALRAARALRFSVTKGFVIDPDLMLAMRHKSVLDSIRNNISDERIREELSKMFRYDTVGSLGALSDFPQLTEAMLSGSVSLDATMKTKGRGN